MKLFYFLWILLLDVTVNAQDIYKNNLSLPVIDSIRSNLVKGQTYKLHIILPPNYKPEVETYPTLYYLDAWEYTGIMNTVARGFMYRGMIEPIILVGISLDANVQQYLNQRNRDLLPDVKNPDSFSGADHFLSFIKEELIPFMEQKYRSNKIDRGLFGHSYGGLFIAYSLIKEPKLFTRLSMASPSFWYQDFALINDQDFLKNVRAIRNKSILVTYGSLENEAIIKGADLFFDLLAINPKIDLEKVVFQDENHVSVIAATCSRVLINLYGKK